MIIGTELRVGKYQGQGGQWAFPTLNVFVSLTPACAKLAYPCEGFVDSVHSTPQCGIHICFCKDNLNQTFTAQGQRSFCGMIGKH